MENNVTEVNFQEKSVCTVETTEAPQAIGPYVQAKVVNGMLYASGQIALDPVSGELVGETIEDQTYQVFAAFNQIYASFFDKEKPSRSCVGVANLPKDALVEVEIIAVIE